MSFESSEMREQAVAVRNLGKRYVLYTRPIDRLKQFVRPARRYGREFWALREIDFSIRRGEVLGIVGCNGAGKSTLLQLICRTLEPTTGQIALTGRIAALLELGAGFNPEFSGRENIFLNAALLGLSPAETESRLEAIIAFSGIGEFIDQPVKTYSSGMYVRLAFSIAVSVDPDILIIDEALSVGDGEFARKSFDRIMSLRDKGVTILFCSHLLFQVETLCDQVLWLDQGQKRALGIPSLVLPAYQAHLDRLAAATPEVSHTVEHARQVPTGHARLTRVTTCCDGTEGAELPAHTLESTLVVRTAFSSDPELPVPGVAVTIHAGDGRIIASAGTWNDGLILERTDDGCGSIELHLDRLPLLKGSYTLSVFLMCERGVHFYDIAPHIATLHVAQKGVEQGYFTFPHTWKTIPGA